MKTIIKQSLMVFLLSYCFTITKNIIPYISFISLIYLYYLRTKDYSFIYVSMIFVLILIPRYSTCNMKITSGKVIKVYQNSVIVRNGFHKVLLQTNELPIYDSYIQFDGDSKELISKPRFYEFNFAKYLMENGVYNTIRVENIKEIKKTKSLRGKIQTKIQSMNSHEEQELLNHILLHIRPSEIEYLSFLERSGFSYAAILYFIGWLNQYIFNEEQNKKICFVVTIIFAIIYRFPMILLHRIINNVLCYSKKMNYQERTGITLLICLMLFPQQAKQAGFVFPMIIKLSNSLSKRKKASRYFYLLVLQSLLFQSVNLISTLIFPFTMLIMGCLTSIAFVHLFIPTSLLTLVSNFDYLCSMLNLFEIKGSILGTGTIFFCLLVLHCRKKDYAYLKSIALFIIFQYTGLFHPFPSITFIDVGQGDGILIRGPLNQENYILDTGKQSAWNHLNNYLDALSIKKLHTLYISHQDIDHCENKENILNSYDVSNVQEEHFIKHENNYFTFYDLNEIISDDENQNSLVHYFSFNGLKVLSTGDADAFVEKKIIRKYPKLKCDIFKLSHHGSNTGNHEKFLDTIQPSIGIVSSGSYHIYHHPNKHVIQRLNSKHIPWFDTKEEGDIAIIAVGKINILVTASKKICILSKT